MYQMNRTYLLRKEKPGSIIVITLICFSLLSGLINTTSAQNNSNSPVSVKSNGYGISVLLGGKVRLRSGAPDFENEPNVRYAPFFHDKTFDFHTMRGDAKVTYKVNQRDSVISFFLSPGGLQSKDGTDFMGIFFNDIPGFKKGMSFWRYTPVKAWTKPILVHKLINLKSNDIQFFYWRYADGTYGAAVPLSGNGYMTTLGQNGGYFGSKSRNLVNNRQPKKVPQMSIGFGKDPYRLFARLYRNALQIMGRSKDLRTKKTFPKVFKYIGWCTWNASDNGKNLNSNFVINSVKAFNKEHFPLGWILIDDGWFQQKGGELESFKPNPQKFPHGFKPMIHALKTKYGVRNVGVWHAFDGYWNGIKPDSKLGHRYSKDLFSWKQKVGSGRKQKMVRYHFLKSKPKVLNNFYGTWYKWLKGQGFSFVKVDNQLVVERMSKDNYPVWNYATALHRALNKQVNRYFKGAIINCMDMTPDAYFNFGSTAIARSEEDYFPYNKKHPYNYNLEMGNSASHVMQAMYNALYFGQMVYPDFDMFESYNPNARLQAVTRALNDGPIYLTDKPGKQNLKVLRPLVYSDGRIIRSDTPLLPTKDCLFQLQKKRVFKAFSHTGNKGLLAVMNLANTNTVKGTFSPADVPGLKGNTFAVYEYFSKKLQFAQKSDKIPVRMKRMGAKVYDIVPLKNGIAPIGLINKYNSAATLLSVKRFSNDIKVTLYEGGIFAAAAKQRPKAIKVDGKMHSFDYKNGLVKVNIQRLKKRRKRIVEILF